MDFLKPSLYVPIDRRRKIYEGKAKILYEGPEPFTFIQHFKDDFTAFNNKKHAVIQGKSALVNLISEHIFANLNSMGIPTHFIRRLNMREQLIRKAEMIPLEVVIRNIAAGSIVRRLNLVEGAPLPRYIVEFFYKNDECGDPLVSEEHIAAFNWASPHEIEEMIGITMRVNDFLSGLFLGAGIRFVDCKLEFGRIWGEDDTARIVLADEITPDTCRLWDLKTGDKLDKDIFRQELGNVLDGYREVARRLGVLEAHADNKDPQQ